MALLFGVTNYFVIGLKTTNSIILNFPHSFNKRANIGKKKTKKLAHTIEDLNLLDKESEPKYTVKAK